MKILLYAITLPDLGGAQSHVLQLIEGFRSTYLIHLVTSAEGPLTESARKLGITVHILPTLGRAINPINDVRAVGDCIGLFHSIKPDLIHVHSSKAGLVGRIAARLLNIPCVFTAHGWGFKPAVPFLRRWLVWMSEFFSAPLATRIICVSKYDEQLAMRYKVGNSKTRVMIHNGLSDCSLLATPESSPIKIIMLARFQEPKEQKVLLHAFAELPQLDVRLIFVGAGPQMSSSQLLAQSKGISSHVDFLGDRTDVPRLLAQSHIFILLSRYEGLPISILEAMRAGLPVIASDVGGVSEEIDHNITGMLVPGGNVTAVKGALQLLIDDPLLRQQMGTAGRQKFLRKFGVEYMLTKTEALYKEIL